MQNQPKQLVPQPTNDKVAEYCPLGQSEKIKLSLPIIKDFLTQPTKSGAVCSDRDAMKFLMLCKSRQLNPFEGDAYLVGYDSQEGPSFSLITAHQAFLKRAEAHPDFDGMESGVIVSDEGSIEDLESDFYLDGQVVLGAWAKVYFKNRSHPVKKRLRLSTRVKSNRFWKEDPAGMIVKCVEVKALRAAFPSVLGGMFLQEELLIAEEREITAVSPPLPLGRNRVGSFHRLTHQVPQGNLPTVMETAEVPAVEAEPAKEGLIPPPPQLSPPVPPKEESRRKKNSTPAPLPTELPNEMEEPPF